VRPAWTAGDRRILESFATRVRTLLPAARVLAFGSRARGTAHPESDWDHAVGGALERQGVPWGPRLLAK
jgi:predicted nucleotidyltransferase